MIHAAPKPAPREKTPRKRLQAKSWDVSTKPRKPLKASGSTKAKKVAKQKAFYSSAAWKKIRKAALERAGGQCEYVFRVVMPAGTVTGNSTYAIVGATWHMTPLKGTIRCPEKGALHVHHKTNVRFGGDERPSDLQCLCEYHHAVEEQSKFPHRQRRRA